MTEKRTTRTPPNKIAIGWIETTVKKDAIELAKGWAQKHLDAPEISRYAVMQFLNGFLYEVQEGGSGLSYLPEAATAMAKGLEPAWFRVGPRAFSVTLRDGRPYCILQPEDESNKLFDSNVTEIQPRGRMTPVVVKGLKTFAVGIGLASTGFMFFVANIMFYILSMEFSPNERNINFELLPHRQWNLVNNVPINMYVESMKYAKGRWAIQKKPIENYKTDPLMGEPPPVPPIEMTAPPPPPPAPAAVVSPANKGGARVPGSPPVKPNVPNQARPPGPPGKPSVGARPSVGPPPTTPDPVSGGSLYVAPLKPAGSR